MSSKEARTRRKICKAFIDLLAQTPYHRISVLNLTRCAGVSRTAFYNNFKTLDDVAMAIYDYSFQQVYQDKFSRPGYAASMEYVRDTIGYFDRFSTFLLAVERQEVSRYYYVMIKKRMLSGCQTEDLLMTEYADYYQAFFLSPVFHVCILWLQKGKKESRKELVQICERMLQMRLAPPAQAECGAAAGANREGDAC